MWDLLFLPSPVPPGASWRDETASVIPFVFRENTEILIFVLIIK